MIAEELSRIAARQPRLIAGFMSGSSMDGIDVALTQVRGQGLDTEIELLGFATTPYGPDLRQRLLHLQMPHRFTGAELAELSYEISERYAEALASLVEKLGLSLGEVDLIGHHGISLYHGDGLHLDMGEATIIAERTGVTVISDFRVRDMAAGGQGAPLSPYVDWILFRHPKRTRAVQNIGGIGNVCAIPAGGEVEDLIGFDTGPGNMIIDGVVSLLTNGRETYDRDGLMARAGQVNETLLTELMQHPFIQQGLPKCAGREEFGLFFTERLLQEARSRGLADADLVATVTTFTARSITDAYHRFITPHHQLDEVIVSGGGSYNPALMEQLRALLAPIPVRPHDDFGIPADAREAVSWAILANETLAGNPANVCQVTGARRRVVLGKIIPGNFA